MYINLYKFGAYVILIYLIIILLIGLFRLSAIGKLKSSVTLKFYEIEYKCLKYSSIPERCPSTLPGSVLEYVHPSQ